MKRVVVLARLTIENRVHELISNGIASFIVTRVDGESIGSRPVTSQEEREWTEICRRCGGVVFARGAS